MLLAVSNDSHGLRIVPEYVFDFFGWAMRVPEECRQATVFIGTELNGSFLPVGTGFLTAIKGPLGYLHFVATAAHLLELVRGDQVVIRLNGRDGQAHSVQIPKSWAISADEVSQDFALIGFPVDLSSFDHKIVVLDRAEWEKERDIWRPGLGDEVAIVGLYSSHFGLIKNVPVVRVGHIAMMPGEPVRTNKGYVAAYLVEGKSIAGLSGSPVFLNTPQFRVNEEGMFQRLRKPVLYELGIVLGYHVVETAEDQISVTQIQGDLEPTALSLDERNTGFTVVLPIEAVLSLVESERFLEMVKVSEREHRARSGYRDAGVKINPAEGETAAPAAPIAHEHKEAFKSLVSAAAKKKQRAD